MAASHISYNATSNSARLPRPPHNGSRQSSSAVQRTKVLLIGLRRYVLCDGLFRSGTSSPDVHRSGKSSIQQVLFNNMQPKQSFYLEPTYRIIKVPIECVLG